MVTYSVQTAPSSVMATPALFQAWLQTFGDAGWIFVEQYEASNVVIFKHY